MDQLTLDSSLFLKPFNAKADQFASGRRQEQERVERTLRPHVFIGIGGCGSKILARTKAQLDWYYRDFHNYSRMRQFVVLDTETHERQLEEVRQAFTQDGEYLFIGRFAPGDFVRSNPSDADLKRWLPKNTPLDAVPLTSGAKGIRPIGRLCLY